MAEKSAAEIYKSIKKKLHEDYELNFDNLLSSDINKVLKAHEYLSNDEDIENFMDKNLTTFHKGLEDKVTDFFKDDLEAGNLSHIEKKADREKKISEFVLSLMEHAVTHYHEIAGYDEEQTKNALKLIKDDKHRKEHKQDFDMLVQRVFQSLDGKNPATWQDLIEHFDTLLYQDKMDIKSLITQQSLQDFYKTTRLGGMLGYATSHIEPYKSSIEDLIPRLQGDEFKDHRNSIKKYADDLVGKFTGYKDLESGKEVDPLNLKKNDEGELKLSHMDAFSLINSLYDKGTEGLLPYKKHVDGAGLFGRQIRNHIKKRTQNYESE